MDNKEREVSLKSLWDIFVHCWWVMALVGFLLAGVVFAYGKWMLDPTYEATATLYILKQEKEDPEADTDKNFSMSLQLINDCDRLIKTHSVLDKVIDELHLEKSYKQLRNSVKITNPTDTRILEVSVVSESPELSKKIADRVCAIGADTIEEVMGFKQVNFFEEGIINPVPTNDIGLKHYLLGAILGGIIVYIVYLMIFFFDDRIGEGTAFEETHHLSILGEIPDMDAAKKRAKYSKYSKYAKKGSGYNYGYNYGYGYGYGYGNNGYGYSHPQTEQKEDERNGETDEKSGQEEFR